MSIVKVVHIPLMSPPATADLFTSEWYDNTKQSALARVERLKKAGHPVEWYEIPPGKPYLAPDMLFAVRAAHTLEALEANSADAKLLYEALETAYLQWIGKLGYDVQSFTKIHIDLFEKYRHQAFDKALGVPPSDWMSRKVPGFNRMRRRPQRNLPVLTIELPNEKMVAGVRETIAEHLDRIGFAVKFKN